MACQQPGKDQYETLDDLRTFMDRKGSNYLVLGDEDADENYDMLMQLVKAVDFRQVAYDHSCYFFERTMPASAEAPSTGTAPTTGTAP